MGRQAATGGPPAQAAKSGHAFPTAPPLVSNPVPKWGKSVTGQRKPVTETAIRPSGMAIRSQETTIG